MAKFHVAMFPWFAIGHITPFIHLANEFAIRGHKITILVPKRAQLQLQHLISLQPPHQDLISFISITVPHLQGLPPGAETASDVHIFSSHLLAAAMDLTRHQVESSLRSSKPDIVFYDFAHWVPDITSQMGIKAVCFSVVSASSLAIALVPARNVPVDRLITEDDMKEPPPGYPSSTVVLRGPEVRSLLFITLPFGDNGITFYGRVTTAMKNSDALCIRTCRELEGAFCDYMGAQFEKQVLLTGPLLPDTAADATTVSLEDRWAEWLGQFEPGSVVFCAFGSQHVLEKDQFRELVLGFELTGLPFLVALKPPVGCDTVEEALPEGFEERVKGRGVVYGGWVQQPLILGSPSVGCFVNHCGFGSMWESLMTDNQIVLVPHLGDQILNTKLLAGELKVAVEVEREENRWFSKESLSKAIKSVMDEDSEVGIMVRNNHATWRHLFRKPGFISSYIDRFVHNLEELVNHK
ncbi:UDP-glucuronosyl/UDP-glucosyltransferase [Parasponia andersonii]|uniref:UDP-glucuronosyl/UDP-glucosyltransferase n=1 Tax=Parasponia andersonii TaxID=3476 RepID=A0A2P5AR44_PARAD|nr:UDP-glucuronosyl/UDP-glucosyltransferase [Parasponia andersonii]